MSAKWTMMVVYEGATARDLAVKFCDGLVKRFWPDFTCELNWVDWKALQDEASAHEAEHKAEGADFIIVTAGDKNALPVQVQRWIEQAIRRRGDREGVLVGLTEPSQLSSADNSISTQLYLRKLAHRGGLDYLTAIPQSLPHTVSDSAESYNVRATQMTSVLGSILSQAHSPRHCF